LNGSVARFRHALRRPKRCAAMSCYAGRMSSRSPIFATASGVQRLAEQALRRFGVPCRREIAVNRVSKLAICARHNRMDHFPTSTRNTQAAIAAPVMLLAGLAGGAEAAVGELR
jgi:hypothetical protein